MSEEYESSNRFPADDKLSLSTWTAYNIFHPFSLQLEVNAIFFFSVRVPIKNRRFIIWDTLTTNAAHISSHRCVVIVHIKDYIIKRLCKWQVLDFCLLIYRYLFISYTMHRYARIMKKFLHRLLIIRKEMSSIVDNNFIIHVKKLVLKSETMIFLFAFSVRWYFSIENVRPWVA